MMLIGLLVGLALGVGLTLLVTRRPDAPAAFSKYDNPNGVDYRGPNGDRTGPLPVGTKAALLSDAQVKALIHTNNPKE